MKIYKNKTVYEESLDRIRRLFDEFDDVVVGVSSGKDSTVVFHLTMQVAKERGRLPQRVLFLDQEVEWQATIDWVKKVMYREDVHPMWMQIPFQLFNATSTIEHWLYCWDEEKKDLWMREKDPIAIHENKYNEVRFASMFPAILKVEIPRKACYIAGVRAEESPGRKLGLTHHLTYKDISWGKQLDKKLGQYTFYPIYDWSYLDVWKAIHENGWDYNNIYNKQYQYGVPVRDMRVSNLHHETAVKSLFHFQELEPETYERATQRVAGLDMAGKLGYADYFVKELPFMFASWLEYRNYLLEKLITDEKWTERFTKEFARMDKKYDLLPNKDVMHKMQIQSILTNDWEMIKIHNWERAPEVDWYRKWRTRGLLPKDPHYLTYIPKEAYEQQGH